LEVPGGIKEAGTPKDVAMRTCETRGLVRLGRLGGACLGLRSTSRAERSHVDDAPLLLTQAWVSHRRRNRQGGNRRQLKYLAR